MKNKRISILLGVILLALVILLIFYAYNLSKSPIVLAPSAEIKKTDLKDASKTDDKLAAIKKEFSINNAEEIVNPVDGQLEEEDQLKITQEPITSAKGAISEIGTDNITVDFDYQGTKWTATVLIDQNTTIYMPALDASSMGEIVEISSFKIGESVIANGESNILNKTSFTGLSIHKVQ